MRRVLSTYLFVEHRMTVALLDRILKSGVSEIELFCARQHLDYHNSQQIDELKYWFREAPMKVHSMHSPLFSDDIWGRSGPQSLVSITETSKIKRIAATDEIKRALEIADSIPFRYLIQHIGSSEEEFHETKLDAAFNCLEALSIFARQLGVEILLENIPNEFSSAERLKYFVSTTHLPLGFCFDTGHARLGAGIEREFALMKDRVQSTHIHDNDGETDGHLFPLVDEQGSIEWKSTMEMLRSAPNELPLLLELNGVDRETPLPEVSQAFERLEDA